MKESEPSLEVTFAGLRFRSPIGLGAVARPFGKNITAEVHAEILLKHVEAGASYLDLPGCIYATEETLRKIQERAKPEKKPPLDSAGTRAMTAYTPVAPHQVEGRYSTRAVWMDPEMGKMAGAHFEEVTKIVKERKPEDVVLIANVMGYGDLPDSYVDAAKKCEQLGIDLIELNLSCPHTTTLRNATEYFFEKRFPAIWPGALIGDHPDIVENITREVVKAVNIPVGVKYSAETGFPRVVGLARGIRDAGAKWITAMNGPTTIAPPDIYNRGKSLWPFADGNPFCSITGPWLRHRCYRDVAAIARFVPGLDIAATGGLMTPQQCVEVMMLGAGHVQLCTGVIQKGRNLIRQSNSFLKKFMIEQGYHSVEEIIGLGQQYIKYSEEVNLFPGKVVSVTDETKCTGCGVCTDNFCAARYLEDGVARVDEENCVGCGSCILGCPVGAIKLVERKEKVI